MPDPISAALAKESLAPVKGLLQRVTGPLADEVGESLALIARPYRFRLSLKMLQKTKRMLSEARIAPQAVPQRLFVPMLEAASIEDDEDLHPSGPHCWPMPPRRRAKCTPPTSRF